MSEQPLASGSTAPVCKSPDTSQVIEDRSTNRVEQLANNSCQVKKTQSMMNNNVSLDVSF